eukprot:11784915-Alexandrium_andersonii.AAC.1
MPACSLGVLSFGYSARLSMQCGLDGSRLPFTAATRNVFDCCIGCAALSPIQCGMDGSDLLILGF